MFILSVDFSFDDFSLICGIINFVTRALLKFIHVMNHVILYGSKLKTFVSFKKFQNTSNDFLDALKIFGLSNIIKVTSNDPVPAELLEQFRIYDMALEQEDNSGSLSVHAQRDVSVLLRERRKSDFNRMSYRKRQSMSHLHVPNEKPIAEASNNR